MTYRFSIYGRFNVEIAREDGAWVLSKLDLGKRRHVDEIAIPSDLVANELATYLDDLYHELAQPGHRVEPVLDSVVSLCEAPDSQFSCRFMG
jgi:hypothetical protein